MYQRTYPRTWIECLNLYTGDLAENPGFPFGLPSNPTVRVTPVGDTFPFCPFLVVAHGVPIFVFYPNESVQYVGPKVAARADFPPPFFSQWALSIPAVRSDCLPNTTQPLRLASHHFYELPGIVLVNSRLPMSVPANTSPFLNATARGIVRCPQQPVLSNTETDVRWSETDYYPLPGHSEAAASNSPFQELHMQIGPFAHGVPGTHVQRSWFPIQ